MSDEERAAMIDLAQMVAAIAARCWENLGTDSVKQIQEGCFKVATVMGWEPADA